VAKAIREALFGSFKRFRAAVPSLATEDKGLGWLMVLKNPKQTMNSRFDLFVASVTKFLL